MDCRYTKPRKTDFFHSKWFIFCLAWSKGVHKLITFVKIIYIYYTDRLYMWDCLWLCNGEHCFGSWGVFLNGNLPYNKDKGTLDEEHHYSVEMVSSECSSVSEQIRPIYSASWGLTCCSSLCGRQKWGHFPFHKDYGR